MDIMRSTEPKKPGGTALTSAEDLLSQFPNLDRAELLKHLTALYIIDFRHGNKREERAACDFLNLMQSEAVKQIKKT